MSNSLLCLVLVIIHLGHVHTTPLEAVSQTWCVANPSSSYDTLENVESYACNYVDCSSIHNIEDPCFLPSNLFSRASYAMNSYYHEQHDCVFHGSGLKSITDPSFGNCYFVGLEERISDQGALGKWCVAKPTASDSALQANIDYACSHIDCSVIQTGGNCQLADTIMNHASIVMNLFYQASNRTDSSCDFRSTGMILIEDPSIGTCLYKSESEEGGVRVPKSAKRRQNNLHDIKISVPVGAVSFILVSLLLMCCGCRPPKATESAHRSLSATTITTRTSTVSAATAIVAVAAAAATATTTTTTTATSTVLPSDAIDHSDGCGANICAWFTKCVIWNSFL